MTKKERTTITFLKDYEGIVDSHFSVWEGSTNCGSVSMSTEAFEVLRFAIRAGWEKAHPGTFDFAYKESRYDKGGD